MNHQEVINFINELIDINLCLIKNGKSLENWKEFRKLKRKRKEAIECIRKLAGVVIV